MAEFLLKSDQLKVTQKIATTGAEETVDVVTLSEYHYHAFQDLKTQDEPANKNKGGFFDVTVPYVNKTNLWERFAVNEEILKMDFDVVGDQSEAMSTLRFENVQIKHYSITCVNGTEIEEQIQFVPLKSYISKASTAVISNDVSRA